MHLESLCEQTVRWPGAERSFRSGERIHTENSYKWQPQNFGASDSGRIYPNPALDRRRPVVQRVSGRRFNKASRLEGDRDLEGDRTEAGKNIAAIWCAEIRSARHAFSPGLRCRHLSAPAGHRTTVASNRGTDVV
jgi:hypothetical protein